ncbi:ADP-ribosyl cyclase/cyclic ADP-ribose hydrolase 1-like [Chanos chanos]|uniref:ADP-ribosyl cyclase/cyclic ADP-ribose hydrolase n=1 Tax=Chanos chanos TaxID=29144 RepID=A0A6J2V1M1_CHACN|nr:ADP-ribosyl cyclase/cyclic ADP-ribose hydrolase 1-like [Chanos chanos]
MSCVSCKCLGIVLGVVLLCALILGLSLGLTLNVKSIVLRRCERYKVEHPERSSEIDCQKIWTAFKDAHVGWYPCDVPVENYDTLMRALPRSDIPCDNRLFWSKTENKLGKFREKNKSMWTLGDTLLGSIITITGCSEDSPFWKRASADFAASTCGHAAVLLSASIDPPYDPDSIFGSVEVKNLNSGSGTVRSLTAYLVTDGKTTTDCTHASLDNLRNDLRTKNVAFSCQKISLSK